MAVPGQVCIALSTLATTVAEFGDSRRFRRLQSPVWTGNFTTGLSHHCITVNFHLLQNENPYTDCKNIKTPKL